MATFHPYPSRLLDLKGERDVLAAMSRLSFEAHVFVRLGILDPRTNLDREFDFIVLHPELGILIVEVKGGRLVQQGGQWHREYRGQLQPMRESPGEQLREQQYLLMHYLKDRIGFVPQITRILALPHMTWPADQDMDGDLPTCRVLDKARLLDPLVNLRSAVTGGETWEVFKNGDRARLHRISDDTMRKLIETLEPAVLPPPTLAELLAEEGALQDREAQMLLAHLAGNFALGRYHVLGAPGSGKSLIARQVARIWASEGRKVLFLAYNKALVHATQIALEDLTDQGSLMVSTFHDLIYNLVYDHGQMPPTENLQHFFDQGLPAAFAEALAGIPLRWDALVVDEAQDLAPAWIETSTRLLRHPDQDPVLLLEDPAQSLYREVRHALGQTWRIELNLRQHPALRRAAWEAFPECGWPAPPVADPAGVFECRRSSPGNWKRDLEGLLQELADQGLRPDQVIILAPHRPATLGLQDGRLLGPWPINAVKDWWEGELAGSVRFGTVQGFKGLEADVVVYLAPDYRHEKAARLRYTAITRARHRVFILDKALAKPAREARPPEPQPAQAIAPARPPVLVIKGLSADRRAELMGAIKATKKGPLAARVD